MCMNPQVPDDDTKQVSGLKILLCSESVPPQVNGIARRIGHYRDGLRDIGYQVEMLDPECGGDNVISFTNPWNFTARMMIIRGFHLFRLLNSSYDIVHVVTPLNFSSIWLMMLFKIKRAFTSESKPALVISWHCNLVDYIECHAFPFFKQIAIFVVTVLVMAIPYMSDRVLSPTKSSDPQLIKLWKSRAGVCHTGIDKSFCPSNRDLGSVKKWTERKRADLDKNKCQSLILCVGRLSDEKGANELIECLPYLKGCTLWLVGDGPARPKLEALVERLDVPVKFWGYQSGEDLHSVYAVADCFVCPSLTETFGQTVNEALASGVRCALPKVKVFKEAYSETVPEDAFWEPLDRKSMVAAIMNQLVRHHNNDPVGLPDISNLKTWEEACESLVEQYMIASKEQKNLQGLSLFASVLFFPVWFMLTFIIAVIVYLFSHIRAFFGGSVRHYFTSAFGRLEIKIKKEVHLKLKS